ncbi:hypothetical protein [Paenibacillus sp. BK033]|nr:hypothetical protein [Paenibacillus sp. BK033]
MSGYTARLNSQAEPERNNRCCRELRGGATQSKLKLELAWERNDGGRPAA